MITVYILLQFDSSRLYHLFRGQTVLKLYVIYNLLEVFDKLCCSFGEDIFDSLVWKTPEGPSIRRLHMHPLSLFIVALIYNCKQKKINLEAITNFI